MVGITTRGAPRGRGLPGRRRHLRQQCRHVRRLRRLVSHCVAHDDLLALRPLPSAHGRLAPRPGRRASCCGLGSIVGRLHFPCARTAIFQIRESLHLGQRMARKTSAPHKLEPSHDARLGAGAVALGLRIGRDVGGGRLPRRLGLPRRSAPVPFDRGHRPDGIRCRLRHGRQRRVRRPPDHPPPALLRRAVLTRRVAPVPPLRPPVRGPLPSPAARGRRSCRSEAGVIRAGTAAVAAAGRAGRPRSQDASSRRRHPGSAGVPPAVLTLGARASRPPYLTLGARASRPPYSLPTDRRRIGDTHVSTIG
jgi:hypothetical protein